jgi:hypothetical protein
VQHLGARDALLRGLVRLIPVERQPDDASQPSDRSSPCEIKKSHKKGSWAEERLFVIMIDPLGPLTLMGFVQDQSPLD